MLNYCTRIIDYDMARYPMRALVARHFLSDLTDLHERVGALPRLEVGKERTALHEHFYQGDETGVFQDYFRRTYMSFMRDVVLAGLPTVDYLIQRIPSFRVHLPGNVATGNFHRDSDFGHQEEELNVIVALTPMEGTSSVYLETERGKRDFWAPRLSPGQALIFHGAVLEHGSYANEAGQTRVSFDARILPRAAYRPGGDTVNNNIPLTLGQYWIEA